MNRPGTAPDGTSDETLWRAYNGDDAAQSWEAFIRIYTRYRDQMRSTMEAAGLSEGEAENRVGAAFSRALEDDSAADIPLRKRLEESARRVAADTNWRETR